MKPALKQQCYSCHGPRKQEAELRLDTGERCLAARRLAERGSRFVLVYLSRYGEWDSHQKLHENHATVLHRLGLKPHQLVVPGCKRLEIDHGRPNAHNLA